MVCAGCKPGYVQSMKSGVKRPGAMRYGGFWIRVAAKIVDGIVLAVLQALFLVPMSIFMFKSGSIGPGEQGITAMTAMSGGMNILSIVIGAAYTSFFIGKFRATPGKMIFKMVVVMPDGGDVSYMRALGRHFAEWISGIILGIGYLMAAFDSQKRTLHDRICSTRVVFK
jgi:uncharacterized RDD family membrane protein YckC